MARKTAMSKEPGNVSIALPQSEKDRLAGRKPQPSPPLRQAPMQRLSPGVYRNSQGQLVGSRGQRLPGQSTPRGQMPSVPTEQQPQMPPPQNVGQGLSAGLLPAGPQPSWRPPAPNQPMGQPQQPGFGMYQPLSPEMMASMPWWKGQQFPPMQQQPAMSQAMSPEQMQQLISGMKSNGNY